MGPLSGTEVALALAVCANLVALLALARPVEGRHARTLKLATSLLQDDRGDALLLRHTDRHAQWWEAADSEDRRLIDRTLSAWDAAGWYARTRRIDRDTILALFGGHVVELWERAYPYVQHRRTQQPGIWASLGELYDDAYEMTPRVQGQHRSVSPLDIPTEPDAADLTQVEQFRPARSGPAAEPPFVARVEAAFVARLEPPFVAPVEPVRSEPAEDARLAALRAALVAPPTRHVPQLIDLVEVDLVQLPSS